MANDGVSVTPQGNTTAPVRPVTVLPSVNPHAIFHLPPAQLPTVAPDQSASVSYDGAWPSVRQVWDNTIGAGGAKL